MGIPINFGSTSYRLYTYHFPSCLCSACGRKGWGGIRHAEGTIPRRQGHEVTYTCFAVRQLWCSFSASPQYGLSHWRASLKKYKLVGDHAEGVTQTNGITDFIGATAAPFARVHTISTQSGLCYKWFWLCYTGAQTYYYNQYSYYENRSDFSSTRPKYRLGEEAKWVTNETLKFSPEFNFLT